MIKNALEPKLTYAIQNYDETTAMRAPYMICKGFVQAGWKVDILTTSNHRNKDIDLAWDQVPVYQIGGMTRRVRFIKLAARMLSKKEKHLVISMVWDWHCFGLALAKWLFGNPFVLVLDTYTYLAPWDRNDTLSRLYFYFRYGLSMHSADIILAETPLCYAHARRYCTQSEVLLVPFCLWENELSSIEAAWEREGYLPERDAVILFTGRLVKRKNVHDLIQAFSTLANRFPGWNLEIRGLVVDYSYLTRLQKQVIESGLGQRVQFLPPLFGEKLYRRYRSSSIYCLPSRGEGMPATITEAMYFGGAVIAGNSGAIGFQLENGRCGMLHKAGDVPSLTVCLETLMSSELERTGYIHKARQRVIDVFTWEKYFPLLEEKFRHLIT